MSDQARDHKKHEDLFASHTREIFFSMLEINLIFLSIHVLFSISFSFEIAIFRPVFHLANLFARTSECDWLVMSSVFVASQSSCFFLCSNENKCAENHATVQIGSKSMKQVHTFVDLHFNIYSNICFIIYIYIQYIIVQHSAVLE